MTIIKKAVLIIFLILLNIFSQHVYAEEVKQQPKQDFNSEITLCLDKNPVLITLEDSLRIALEKNYNIKMIMTEKNRDKWLYYNSLSNFLPDIGLNYTETRFHGAFLLGGVLPTSALPGNFPKTLTATSINAGFTGQWTAFNGFGNYFNAKTAKYVYKSTEKNLDLTKDQILLLTTVQYYTLLQDKLNTEILSKALEENEAELKLNQERFDAGVGTKFDVLRAQAQVAAAKQSLIAAYNNLRLAQAQLANTIGIDIFTPLIPAEKEVTAKTLFKECFDLNKVTEIALKNKPELDIAKLNLAAIRAKRNSGYSIYFPNVSVTTSVNGIGESISNLLENDSVALLVNWQGGQGMGLQGYTAIKALNEQVKEAKLKTIDTQRTVEQSLVNSFYNTLSAKELITASASQAAAAKESLRLSIVRLKAGVGIYTDVIAAQLTETQARINYLNSLINYNISQSQLLFDMGVISPANLLEGYSLQDETNK